MSDLLENSKLNRTFDSVSLGACDAYSSETSLKTVLSFFASEASPSSPSATIKTKNCLFVLYCAHLFVPLQPRAAIYPEYRTLVTLLNCFAVDPTAVGEGQTGGRLTDYVLELSFLGPLDGTFIQRGDANGDGNISVTDIAVVVNCILQLDNNGGFSDYGADANGDGQITVTDIGVIVDKILGAYPQPLPKGGEPQ